MRHERWASALVNEQKGWQKSENPTPTYITVAVTKTKKEYGNFSLVLAIFIVIIV